MFNVNNNWDKISLIKKLILIPLFLPSIAGFYNYFFMKYYKNYWLQNVYGTSREPIEAFILLIIIFISSYFLSKILINLGTEKNYFKPSFPKILWLLFIVVIIRVSAPITGPKVNLFFFPLDFLYRVVTGSNSLSFLPYKGYLGYIFKNMPIYYMVSCSLYYKLHNRIKRTTS